MSAKATREQWDTLFDAAEEVRKLEPWKTFGELNLIALTDNIIGDTESLDEDDEADENLYCRISGPEEGDEDGLEAAILFYQGIEGLNDSILMTCHEELSVPEDYAMWCQNYLGCFFSSVSAQDAETEEREVSEREYAPGQIAYTMSVRKGYFPGIPDAQEVEQLTGYLKRLARALSLFSRSDFTIDRSKNEVYIFKDTEGEERGLVREGPEAGTCMTQVRMANEMMLKELTAGSSRTSAIDIDVLVSDVPTKDPEGDRVLNPLFVLFVERDTGRIVAIEFSPPDMHPGESVIGIFLQYLATNGLPKEIRYSNEAVGTYIRELCRVIEIKLTQTQDMPEMTTAKYALKSRLRGKRDEAVYSGLFRDVLS